jgi:dATP pyrophosphohydrolase
METRMPIRVRGVAAALIVRPSARILILQRNKPTSRGLWSLLMGGIEVSETAGQAIRREIAEELGVHGGEIYAAGCCDTYYNHVAEAIEIMPVFAVLFPAPPKITLDVEHSDHRWASFAEAGEIIAYPGQRAALADIERDFLRHDPPAFRRVAL